MAESSVFNVAMTIAAKSDQASSRHDCHILKPIHCTSFLQNALEHPVTVSLKLCWNLDQQQTISKARCRRHGYFNSSHGFAEEAYAWATRKRMHKAWSFRASRMEAPAQPHETECLGRRPNRLV